MRKYNVKIQGISPLLMHRPSGLIGDISKEKNQKEMTPKEHAEQSLYIDSKEQLFQPATHLEGALVEAGKSQAVIGKGKATYSKIMGYAVEINPFEIIHKKQKWEIFSCLGVINRGRVLIHRPMLKDWEIEFEIIFDEEQIPASILKKCLERAGKYVGIGDWRPAKKGRFGKFQVIEWKELK